MSSDAAPGGTPNAEPSSELVAVDEMKRRLRLALKHSTADEASIIWFETRHGQSDSGSGPLQPVSHRRTITVKAREGRRFGTFRTGHAEMADLHQAIRQAVALSRSRAPSETWQPSADDRDQKPKTTAKDAKKSDPKPPKIRKLFDQTLADLDPESARQRLRELLADGPGDEEARLEWYAAHVSLQTSRGLAQAVRVTSVTLSISSGTGPLAGHAAASGRRIEQLDAKALVRSARARRAEVAKTFDSDAVNQTPGTVLFSQQATAALIIQLNRHALSASTFRDRSSALTDLIGEHVFAPSISLVDNGLDPSGLPFPFDLSGATKRRIEMIIDGVPRSPAVDDDLATALGLPATPHVVGHDESRAANLFLIARDTEDEVLAAADGGLFVNAVTLDCHDPRRLAVRLRASGVRRVRNGGLAEALPDLTWDESLLRLFSQVRAIGGTPIPLAIGGFLGAISAPLLVVDAPAEIRPARDIT